MLTLKDQIDSFMDTFFELPLKSELVRYTLDDDWLTVYYKNNETADDTRNPNNWNWKILCAQGIQSYCHKLTDTEEPEKVYLILNRERLLNRITLMLFESVRSKNQDVNILLAESKTW